MFQFLSRVAMFIVGVVLLIDIGLPTSTETLSVDRHTSSRERLSNGGWSARWADTDYTLHFIGGRVSSCSVGYSAYGRLKDGDAVDVQATKLFKSCIRIAKGGEIIESDKYWKILAFGVGAVLIAVALGWLRSDDERDFRSS